MTFHVVLLSYCSEFFTQDPDGKTIFSTLPYNEKCSGRRTSWTQNEFVWTPWPPWQQSCTAQPFWTSEIMPKKHCFVSLSSISINNAVSLIYGVWKVKYIPINNLNTLAVTDMNQNDYHVQKGKMRTIKRCLSNNHTAQMHLSMGKHKNKDTFQTASRLQDRAALLLLQQFM